MARWLCHVGAMRDYCDFYMWEVNKSSTVDVYNKNYPGTSLQSLMKKLIL